MNDPKYIITGFSRLAGKRLPVCSPKTVEQCEAMVDQYRILKGRRGPQAYTRLRIERVKPIELTINFDYYEQ